MAYRRLHADAALRRMLRLDEPRHVLLTRAALRIQACMRIILRVG